MNREPNIEQIKSDAEAAYRTERFSCAEAVVYAIRKHIAPDMPKELISAATGFAVGVGRAQCMCGTVSAAVLCLGYFFGRTFPTTITDPQSQKTIALAHELQAHFKNKNKVLCCHVHCKEKDMEQGGHMEQCAGFVGDMAANTAKLIAREFGLRSIA